MTYAVSSPPFALAGTQAIRLRLNYTLIHYDILAVDVVSHRLPITAASVELIQTMATVASSTRAVDGVAVPEVVAAPSEAVTEAPATPPASGGLAR